MSNNPSGSNQWGPKDYPPDKLLSAELHQYAKECLPISQRLQCLEQKFSLKIGKTKLTALNSKFSVPSPRKPLPTDVATQAVLEKVANDTAQRNGVGTILTLLGNDGIALPRDFVRRVLAQHAPDSLAQQFPGARGQIRRSALVALGPNYQWHADGHDKIAPQAFSEMGGVGIPIYGIKDQWSSLILHLVVVPNNRLATTIGHVHLDCVEKHGVIPIGQIMDKGSETRYVFVNQTGLREAYAPDINSDKYPAAVHLKSVHNTPIEGLWHWFTNTMGFNLKEELRQGYKDGIFYPGSQPHVDLFNWLWPQIIQKELDIFTAYWNNHRIRYQAEKPNASGTTPSNAFALPKSVSAQAEQCGIVIDKFVVDALRKEIPVSREEAMRYVSDEFCERAKAIYRQIGSPQLKAAVGWSIFTAMARYL
ncbi:hypothetical protein DFH05DRAFT_1536392 [Lentinula detonsa]|uniref:Integrase core domain-containing protein n=1 Tax=Lentinula detonsa TaxID=2804962 RepID=A0A9W8TVR1_9AGAR|nr:hypothetical protein DFH05DRAFT_1536392 [Lentinula detonsa]